MNISKCIENFATYPTLTIGCRRLNFKINGKTIAAYLKDQQCYGCNQVVAGIGGEQKDAFAVTGLCAHCREHIIKELEIE